MLAAFEVCAQTWSSDVDAVRGENSLAAGQAMFTPGNAGQLLPGAGTMPAEAKAFGVSSFQQIGGKGSDFLAFCLHTPNASLTPLQKAECDATIASADISAQRFQYGNIVTDRSQDWSATADRKARARAAADPTLGGANPLFSTKAETCVDRTTGFPQPRTEETCSVSYAPTPQSCTNTLSVQVTTTYTVTGTDPATGNSITYGTSTSLTDAQALQTANPGSTISSSSSTTDTWTNGCASLDANQLCDFDGEQCTLGPMDKTIDGQTVTRACWQKTRGYTCYSASSISTCQALQTRGCTETSRTCAVQRGNGQCADATVVFSCPAGSPLTATNQDCSGGELCVGAACFNTSKRADRDFGMAMTYMEAGREGAVYAAGSPGAIKLFYGEQSSCTKPVGPGWGDNCCKVSSGAETNNQVLGSSTGGLVGNTSVVGTVVGGIAISTAVNNIASIGTHYTYDFMMQSGGNFTDRAIEAIGAGKFDPTATLGDLLSGPSFSMYGFSLSTTAPILDSTVTLASDIAGTGYNLTFNPYVFAAMVAFKVITEMMATSCTTDMQMLAMRRGANLCGFINSYCSKRLPWPLKTCIQETEVWCCWNSRLSKAIATQAKCQLGACGNGPACSGLSPQEMALVDFSKIDLSEFMGEMTQRAQAASSVFAPANVERLQTHVGTNAIQNPAILAPNSGLVPTNSN